MTPLRCFILEPHPVDERVPPFLAKNNAEHARLMLADYREHRYRKVRFANHDVYNIPRRLLYRYKPQQFLVDARTQIGQTATGKPLKRATYYLKRGYYPPNQKALTDSCLARLAQGKRVGAATIRKLLRAARSPFWVYPVERYVSKRPHPPAKGKRSPPSNAWSGASPADG